MPYVVANDIIIADVCYHSFVMVTCTLYFFIRWCDKEC